MSTTHMTWPAATCLALAACGTAKAPPSVTGVRPSSGADASAPVPSRRSDGHAHNRLVIHADGGRYTIDRNLYGQFSEHLGRSVYEGIWVGEDSTIPHTRGIRKDVVAALRKIRVPVLRWPGGCFADEYHWQDGIGPRNRRPAMINTHWGGVVENNQFGTHEFLDFCEQIGAAPYISGNVGSGTVKEMMEWVEYMTSAADSPIANLRRKNGRKDPWNVPYFGIGNESWGCGGSMTADFYADNFRRYNTFVKNYGEHTVRRIACGANGSDYDWTEHLMKKVGGRMDGLSLHHYTLPTGDWSHKGSATQFTEAEWHSTLRRALEMDDLIFRHAAIMDKYDPEKRVGLVVDEWGAWYDVEPGTNAGFLYQESTLRDALVAGVTLNVFNRHADRVKMANLAQMINVLQALILTDKEKMVVTPTYHVFEMYTVHHDATLLPTDLESADYELDGAKVRAIDVSASRDKAGQIHVTLCNLDPNRPAEVACELEGAAARKLRGRVLTAPEMSTHNTVQAPDAVTPAPFSAFSTTDKGFAVTLPAKSVVVLTVE
jgi:alpha-N-arabinofuranosidase